MADHAEALPEYSLLPDRSSFSQVNRLAGQTWRSMELGGRPAFSLVGALEERFGVKIFFDDLGSGESAACVRGNEDAAILMNKNESPWRQRFSFAHELFHLVTWDSVMSAWPDGDKEPTWSNRMESLANVFASALILPGDIVRTEFRSRFEEEEPTDTELVDMARSYGVSTEALLWRLRNLDLMSEEAVRTRLNSPEFRQLDRMTMGTHWDEAPPNLPERFVRLIILAYQAGDLSRSSAAKYLEMALGDLYYLDWDDESGSPANAGRT